MQNPAFAYVMTKITPKQQDFYGIRAVGDFGNFGNDVDSARVFAHISYELMDICGGHGQPLCSRRWLAWSDTWRRIL